MRKAEIGPKQLLQHLQVPGPTRDAPPEQIYVIGSFEQRVTLYSQQVRALNLAYALFEQGVLRAGSKVVVIGGGVAGVTAAAGLAQLGAKVRLVEHTDVLLPLQKACRTRWVHPHIYDWPDPDSEDPKAHLPLLPWTAGYAHDVASELEQALERVSQRTKNIRITLLAQIQELRGGALPRLWMQGTSPSGQTDFLAGQAFDAVIIAVGFGLESGSADLPMSSYWRNDDLDQPVLTPQVHPVSHLVSGNGDGGIIDVLRLRLREFRLEALHKNLLNLFAPAELERIRSKVREYEAAAENQDDDWLWTQYVELLSFPDEVQNLLRSKLQPLLRGDTKVWLASARAPITFRSAILNRLWVALLVKYDTSLKAVRSRTIRVTKQGATTTVTFESPTAAGTAPTIYDRVIVRHGPKPALGGALKWIDDRCRPVLGARNALDQTRWPIWSPEAFQAEAPAIAAPAIAVPVNAVPPIAGPAIAGPAITIPAIAGPAITGPANAPAPPPAAPAALAKKGRAPPTMDDSEEEVPFNLEDVMRSGGGSKPRGGRVPGAKPIGASRSRGGKATRSATPDRVLLPGRSADDHDPRGIVNMRDMELEPAPAIERVIIERAITFQDSCRVDLASVQAVARAYPSTPPELRWHISIQAPLALASARRLDQEATRVTPPDGGSARAGELASAAYTPTAERQAPVEIPAFRRTFFEDVDQLLRAQHELRHGFEQLWSFLAPESPEGRTSAIRTFTALAALRLIARLSALEGKLLLDDGRPIVSLFPDLPPIQSSWLLRRLPYRSWTGARALDEDRFLLCLVSSRDQNDHYFLLPQRIAESVQDAGGELSHDIVVQWIAPQWFFQGYGGAIEHALGERQIVQVLTDEYGRERYQRGAPAPWAYEELIDEELPGNLTDGERQEPRPGWVIQTLPLDRNARPPRRNPGRPPLAGRRILWVDDNPHNNRFEVGRLEQLGATVERAATTEFALTSLQTHAIHLVISDLNRIEHGQPRPTAGLELQRRARQLVGTPVPFVFYIGRRADAPAEVQAITADQPTALFDLVLRALASDPTRGG
jgi:CheY-like chemotaxis protein